MGGVKVPLDNWVDMNSDIVSLMEMKMNVVNQWLFLC